MESGSYFLLDRLQRLHGIEEDIQSCIPALLRDLKLVSPEIEKLSNDFLGVIRWMMKHIIKFSLPMNG
jgi:hypothetical protein